MNHMHDKLMLLGAVLQADNAVGVGIGDDAVKRAVMQTTVCCITIRH